MYLAYRDHNIRPSDFYNMTEGEKNIIKAFAVYELEHKKHTCPLLGGGNNGK